MRALHSHCAGVIAAFVLVGTLVVPQAYADDAPIEGAPAVEEPIEVVPGPSTIAPEALAKADPAATGSGAPPEEFTSGNLVGDTLRDLRRRDRAWFNLGLRDAAVRFEDMVEERIGLRFGAAYTMLYQGADRGSGPKESWGGDLDIVGIWKPKRQRKGWEGSLQIGMEGRHRIATDIPPQSLSKTIDSLWPTVSGFNEQRFSLIQLYWGQDLFRGRMRIRIGKISPYFFFGNRLNDASTAFLNASFSDSPAVFFPGNGFGVQVRYNLGKDWIVRGGIQNANGIKTEFSPESLDKGEFWYGFEIEKRVNIRRLGHGRYRLGFWYVDPRADAGTGDGAGTSISIDQEIGPKVLVFFRSAAQGASLITPDVQEDSLTATKRALRVGFGVDGPIRSQPDDYFGFAIAWGKPSAALARNSIVAESFYRLQLTEATHFSVSLQAIRSSTIFEQVFVLGLRLRVEF